MLKNYLLILLLSFSLCKQVMAKDYAQDNISRRYSSLVINASNGDVLYKHNADALVYPASLTKMMTVYVAFQNIKSHRLSLNTSLPVSRYAASKQPTKLWLKAGQKISLRDALYGVIVHSANDASVAIAEAICGTEEAFAIKMTNIARQLGMSNTVFYNSTGLHHSGQVTTAIDMAKLAIALRRDFPELYPMFSKHSFVYRGAVVNGHNRVLKRYRGADGLKTGYVSASGFNLVTSVNRPEGKVIGVVIGGSSRVMRDNHMIALLDQGYTSLSGSRRAGADNTRRDVFLAAQVDGIDTSVSPVKKLRAKDRYNKKKIYKNKTIKLVAAKSGEKSKIRKRA